MKERILACLIIAIAFFVGYQVGYSRAPRTETIDLVMPEKLVPAQPEFERL